MTKTILVGIDGSRLDLIKKWAGEGSLPNMKKIIETGCSGDLRSILPGPHTAPAWVTFATGKNPGKHGISYMLMRKEDYELKIVSSHDVKAKALWEYLSDAGEFSCVLNVPMTYPPKPINGIIVTSWGTPALESDYTYPSGLKEELKQFDFSLKPEYDRTEESTKAIYDLTISKIKATEWLMEKNNWNLFVSVFFETEEMHHLYSSFLDKEHHYYNQDYEKLIKDFYGVIDEFFGRLLEKYSNINIIIISDHGFCAPSHYIYLNNILEKNSLFFKSTSLGTKKRGFYEKTIWALGETYQRMPGIMKGAARRVIPKFFKERLRDTKMVDADWSRTKAYCPAKIGIIHLNVKGREPEGIVDPGDYERVRDEIIQTLRNDSVLKGKIKGIWKREDIFSGPYTDEMPDIILSPEEKYEFTYTTEEGMICEPKQGNIIGCHTMNGVIMAHGPDIATGEIKNAELIDIVPTVLHMHGLAVPSDIDGRVLHDLFKKESIMNKRKPLIIPQLEEDKIISAVDSIDI
ncbi:MAG: alkaline phosphatase family protein [Candidatus Aenigmarchaeota archaeon]|nr:alkaline phosphatase family protein [Candidatus Aenigmarchaeota archaeon]